ncbi:MAG: transcriptional regulator GcvA [Burkholderiaceae bacterium]|nr:transcriptional regulator GcvA [Burkholderiaceae bacterium]
MQDRPGRLPSLDLLLTFEAAARNLSFTLAAGERFVTQSAVSRQIRTLEDSLGVELFHRGHRSLALTDQGALLRDACREALGPLRETIDRMRARNARQVLTLTTTPGLAALWLIPRLARFTGAHPGVDVRIDASLATRDFERDGIDVAVRYGAVGATPGVKLFDEEVFPVCAPSLLAAGPKLETAADLARHTLLRIDLRQASGLLSEWQPWFTAMGLPDLEPRAEITFTNFDAVASAAVHGQGVALGRRPLVDALLADGRLVAPLADTVSSARAYFLIVAQRSAHRAETRALRGWLLDEACAPRPGGAAGGPPLQPPAA